MNHQKFMSIALNLARRGVGNTGTNPSVACVVVKDGIIISTGCTHKSGRPHAEAIALKGINAKGSTIYVTLEPCSHHGLTPPCADAVIKAKPSEVVVACLDPDSRINGRGLKMIAEAGIKVTLGVGEKEALHINRGFISRVTKARPFVTLKAAISADGKYLEGTGKPQMFTGELAQKYVHILRSRSNVLITGTGTIIADNPQLNVRLPGLEDTSPVIAILGSSLRGSKADEAIQRYPRLLRYARNDSLLEVLEDMGSKGINDVLLECGSTLANAFIQEKLVDEIIIIQSPKKLGTKGKDYFAPNALKDFQKTTENVIGDDRIIIFNG